MARDGRGRIVEDDSWTEEDLAKLRNMVKKHTVKRVAELLKRPYDSVRHKMRSLSLRGKPTHATDTARLRKIEAYSKKHGPVATAKKFKMSLDQVKGQIYRYRQAHRKRIEDVANVSSGVRIKALRYANAHDMHYVAEDFASYCVVRHLEGTLAEMRWALTDYQRETFGNVKTAPGRVQMNETLSGKPVHETDSVYEDDSSGQMFHVPSVEPKNYERVMELLSQCDLEERLRMVYLLRHYFSFDGVEIALLFGVTPGRVSQLIIEAEDEIERRRKTFL